jgi:cephalosporin hydroxylase
MDPLAAFEKEKRDRLAAFARDAQFTSLSCEWLAASMARKYVYDFNWLGRPVIQYPQDMVAVQELIWEVRPDLVIETGIAHGGSLILSASLLALLDLCDAAAAGTAINPRQPRRKVIGVDIDIRAHNRRAVDAHPLSSRIEMIEGSSIAPEVVQRVRSDAEKLERVLVLLDSNHTHDHVLAELEAYAPLVSPGSYCVVFDTLIEDLPAGFFADRPWDVGNNPRTAIAAWLPRHPEFSIDTSWDSKLMITAARGGFLKRAT